MSDTCRICGKEIETWKKDICSQCLLAKVLTRDESLLGRYLAEREGEENE